jgi:hypothetical protein
MMEAERDGGIVPNHGGLEGRSGGPGVSPREARCRYCSASIISADDGAWIHHDGSRVCREVMMLTEPLPGSEIRRCG